MSGENNVVLIFPHTAVGFISTLNITNLSVSRMEFGEEGTGLTGWSFPNAGITLTLTGAAGDNIWVKEANANVVWQPGITLRNTCRLNTSATASSFEMQGVVAGTGGLVKRGPGSLLFSAGGAANTFSGPFRIEAGVARLNKTAGTPCFGGPLELVAGSVQVVRSHQIPDNAPITITDGTLATAPPIGTYVTEQIGPVTLNGTVLMDNIVSVSQSTVILGGNVTLGSGASRGRIASHATDGWISLAGTIRILTVPDAEGLLECSAHFLDGGAPAGLDKQGAGELWLTGESEFTGPVNVAAGVVSVGSTHALGYAFGATSVQSGATVRLGVRQTAVPVWVDETINLAGNLEGVGSSTAAGPVVLVGTPTLAAPAGTNLTLSGLVSGSAANVTVAGEGGTVTFDGTAPNTFTSPLTVTGRLNLAKSAGVAAVLGQVTLSGGSLKLLSSEQIADSASILYDGGGTFELNGMSETIATLTSMASTGARVTLGSGSLSVNGTTDAVLGGDSTDERVQVCGTAQSRLRKIGSNKWTVHSGLPANAAEFPTLSVEAGTMELLGEWPGAVELKGGVLRGNATTGALTGLGGSVCLCQLTATSFSGPVTVLASINGDTPGTGYDRMKVSAPLVLTGQSLQVEMGAFTPVAGGTFMLIDNCSGAPVTGTFAGMPEGARIQVNGQPFRITYRGGSGGQDVVLRFEGLGTPGPEITSVRRVPGNQVEVSIKWKPGVAVTVQASPNGFQSWGTQKVVTTDAQGLATATFAWFGGEGFFRLSIF